MRLALFVLVLSAAPATAQTDAYWDALDAARTLADAGDLEAAVEGYGAAFDLARPTNEFTAVGAAETAVRAGRPRRAFAFLHQAVKAGLGDPSDVGSRPLFASLRANRAWWARWTAAYHRAQAATRPAYDPTLAQRWIVLWGEKQRTWDHAYELRPGSPISSTERAEMQARVDALSYAVQSQTLALLEEQGWPLDSEVAYPGTQAAFIIVADAPA